MSGARRPAVALVCFGGKSAAGKARKHFETKLQADGDNVLQTTVLAVTGAHKASVHDPARVLRGTLTAALTWGLFGLVAGSNKIESTIVWAVIGAICGGAYAYTTEHVLTKSQLKRIGHRLSPNSSALVTFAETTDPRRLLESAGTLAPTTASVVVIDDDLQAQVFAGTTMPLEVSRSTPDGNSAADETSLLTMLVYRYSDPKLAARVAAETAKRSGDGGPEVELVIETDPNGHRHVSDPSRGTAAWARADVVSWGLFGVAFGAIAGAVGGGGLHGAVTGAVATGVGWAVFGLVAGALYGLWAGRSISARRLKGIGPLLAPGTSVIVAWGDGDVRRDGLAQPGSQRLALRFNPIDRGAVLEAT